MDPIEQKPPNTPAPKRLLFRVLPTKGLYGKASAAPLSDAMGATLVQLYREALRSFARGKDAPSCIDGETRATFGRYDVMRVNRGTANALISRGFLESIGAGYYMGPANYRLRAVAFRWLWENADANELDQAWVEVLLGATLVEAEQRNTMVSVVRQLQRFPTRAGNYGAFVAIMQEGLNLHWTTKRAQWEKCVLDEIDAEIAAALAPRDAVFPCHGVVVA